MDNLLIRAATEADLPAILELYGQPGLDDGIVLCVEDAQRVFARFARYPDYTLYAALSENRVVASFALLIMDNLGHLGTPSAIAEDVVVSPECQGMGIGRRMIAFARERCTEKGCYKLALSSNLKRDRAHEFYESIGFEKHGYSFRVTP